MADNISIERDPELETLLLNKESGFNYRQRRQADWDTNYTLYRDKVQTNRLTQRQSVNVPLMKQTIRTLLKDVDDMPIIEFQNRDNNKQAEVFQNEYWRHCIEYNKMEIKDIVDKKQVFMFGRTFDQMQIVNGQILMTIEDPEDILVDRYMDPTNIDSSRFLIHTHIFVPLSSLEKNPAYDKTKIAKLRKWHETDQGIVKATDNADLLVEKNQKMRDMGVPDVDDPVLGETYIELSQHFVYDTREGSEDEELFLKVEADNMVQLMSEPLDKVIGPTKDDFWKYHLPYNTWADDIDRQDFWTDGVADLVRTPNMVLNAWFSQLVENRTLRNFGMNYFDATIDGFAPQTFQPIPGGWYGLPGKPKDVYQKVDIPDLSESLDEMQFIIGMIEKASGATATQQGAQTERQVTLGEVQLALGEAKARIKGMAKFYTHAWKERAHKFLKLIEAAPDKLDMVKVYKQGRNTTKIYGMEIEPKNFMTESGYGVKIWSKEDKTAEDTAQLEKLNAVIVNIPDNPRLLDIYQRKLLEFADLKPEEINDVMEIEKQKQQARASLLQAQREQVQQQQMQNTQMPGPNMLMAPQPQMPTEPPPPPVNTEAINKLQTIRQKLKKK